MKILVALSVIQFGLLLFLVGKVAVLNRDIGNLATVEALQPSTGAAIQLSTDGLATTDPGQSEAQLRTIIREELSNQFTMLPQAAVGSDSPQTFSHMTDPADQARDKEQLESVMRKIEYYESVGSISDYQMQELQSEIVRLNSADRREGFKRLMRSMNSGAVEGQL